MKHKTKLHKTPKAQSGFTIIEVTLVTAFMAMLMIAIAIITTSIAALYQRGLTLKTINSVGRNLVTELTTSINSAPSVDSVSLCNGLLGNNDAARNNCIANHAFNYLYYSYEDSVENPDTNEEEPIQYGGIICTGNYSYVWNTYYGINSNHELSIRYERTDETNPNRYITDEKVDFKLIRFRDRNYRACSAIYKPGSYTDYTDSFNSGHVIDITRLANNVTHNPISDFQEHFLETSNANSVELSLYELTLFPISQDSVTLRSLFSGTFILATERGDVNVVRTGDYCSVDGESEESDTATDKFSLGSEFNYCGINKFNFAARTAGSGV